MVNLLKDKPTFNVEFILEVLIKAISGFFLIVIKILEIIFGILNFFLRFFGSSHWKY